MKIFNIRFGFATNSSSSHSLVFTKNSLQDSGIVEGEFGWNNFIAASDDMKLLYVATLADYILSNSIPDILSRQALLRHLLGNENITTYFGESEYGSISSHIDHNSAYNLPVDWPPIYSSLSGEFVNFGKFIDIEFLKDFANYFLQKGLVIVGGNDNEKPKNYPGINNEDLFVLPVPMDRHGEWIARKDKVYNYWSLFNKYDGTKVRFSFDDINAKAPERAFAPELLDIKITEKCPFSLDTSPNSCARWCYQNSQVNGKEFSVSDAYLLASCLRNLKVFEVAFGGGEPTSHPKFISILETFKAEGIVPNFSTRDLSWLKDDSKWPRILKACGSFAYSVREAKDVTALHNLMINKDLILRTKNKASIQVAMGTVSKRVFRNIIMKAGEYGIRVTLLGYKNTGRGLEFTPIDYSWMLSVIKQVLDNRDLAFPHISVDTTLAEQSEDEIIALDIPNWMFHTQEGRFSAYLDAVQGKFGPSSFCEPSEMFDLHFSENDKNIPNNNNWVFNLDRKILKLYPQFK